MSTPLRLQQCLVVVVASVALETAQADDRYWLAPIGGNFTDNALWLNGVPGPGDVAVFGATAGAAPFTIANDGTIALAGLVVANQSPTFTAGCASFPVWTIGATLIGGGLDSPPHVSFEKTYLFVNAPLTIGSTNTADR